MESFKTITRSTRQIAESVDFALNMGVWSFAFGFISFATGLAIMMAPDVSDTSVRNSVGLVIMGGLSLSIIAVKLAAFLLRKRVLLFDLVRASYPVRGLLRLTAFILMAVVVLPRTGHNGGIFWGCVDAFLLVTSVFCLALYAGPFAGFVKNFRARLRLARLERSVLAALAKHL